MRIQLLLLVSFFSFVATAQDKWEVSKFTQNSKQISINTDEGTWINLDVSPDGKSLVFDLLGDIYTMPISGGKAKLIRGGMAWEVQPRYSPDGKQIAFTSDFGGGDNIWVMNTNGENARQVTKEDFRLLCNPYWSPDGEYIFARKHFTATRSAGAGEIWMYHITGGSGVGLTKRRNDQQDVNEPNASGDGKYVYFSEDMYPGGSFQYNKDPNKQIYVIKRFNRLNGEIEVVTGGSGGAFRPQISKKGDKLAFVRRVRTKTILFIRDMSTGEEYPIYDNLSKDQQEAWALFGVYTGFSWTNNDKEIVFWANGKINKIDVDSKKVSQIPFEVNSSHTIVDALSFKQNAFEEKFTSKAIRNAVSSPDGKFLIFNAIGSLWKKDLPNGKPVQIAKSNSLNFEPSFNPTNPSQIVFVSWDDEQKGKILIYDIITYQIVNELNVGKGIYRNPSFSPDGSKIVYVKEEGNDHQGFSHCVEPGIYVYDMLSKSNQRILNEGDFPTFSKSGDKVYFQTGGYLFGSLDKQFKSFDLNTQKEQVIFKSKYTNRFVLSNDEKWIAFNELHNVYLAAMPLSGVAIDINRKSKEIPVAKISSDAGINPHWLADNQTICWTLGGQYFSVKVSDVFGYLNGNFDEFKAKEASVIDINLEIEADKPKGTKIFTNATIITVDSKFSVLKNASVIVVDNVIKEVGTNLTIPQDAEVIDCQGKVIMPGMVDVHAHLGTFRYGLSPQKHWQYWANLAYGVTTTHDPSSNSEMVFSQSEMVKSGVMVGPRIFSTGVILYGADGDFKAEINSLDDARAAIRRTKAFGAFSVKSYNQPRREQRQQVITAARENQIMVFPEGGSHFYHNLSMIADGHTGIEHNIPVAPLYKDVLQFWSQSKTANTPTLIVSYGSVSGEYEWYQKSEVWSKERLLRFTPRGIIDNRSRHRTIIPEEEYENGHILVSKSLNNLNSNGVKINLGSHGQLQGLGAHWETWMIAQGGMSNEDVIKSITINGANYIGMGHEIGSIEKGKLADFIILNKDPLEDIKNTESIEYTVINGRVYQSETMHELGSKSNRTKFWWESQNYDSSFQFHEKLKSQVRCECGN